MAKDGEQTVTFTLYECEHVGDIQHYLSEIGSHGNITKVISVNLNQEAETCKVVCKCKNPDALYERLKEIN